MSLDPEQLTKDLAARVQRSLDDQEAEIRLLRLIVFALFEQSTDQPAVIARLRGCVEQVASEFPVGHRADAIIELRTRAEVYYKELLTYSNPKPSGQV